MRKISKGNSLKPAKQIQKLFLLFFKIIFRFFLEKNNYFSLFLKVKEEEGKKKALQSRSRDPNVQQNHT